MKTFSNLRVVVMTFVLGASTFVMAADSFAQAAPAVAADSATGWTTEQLLTSTVHDAWVLSGKDEAKFFEMVKTLAELSATRRGITLPDTKDAGMRMGANIKRLAKADTDQLLYVVVDKAVMMAGHAKPVPAGSRSATPAAQ